MNKYITSSIFLAAGLSSLTAVAQSNTSLKGSDTLFDLTKNVIVNCGTACAGLTYVGTGSGPGETAMGAANTAQNVAPMSRFLNGGANPACNGVTTTFNGTPATYTATQVQQSACGLVVGLDGVSVLGSMYTAGKAACDGTSQCTDLADYPPVSTSCGTGTNPVGQQTGVGLAYDSQITWAGGNSLTYGRKATNTHSYAGGTYTFQDWTDVLRIIYAGTDKHGCQDCESDVRNGIVQNWGNIFEDGNVATTNCNGPTGPTCTQLNHAWRRDAESGTTDTFLALLGLPSVFRDTTTNLAVDDPFCNGWRTDFPNPAKDTNVHIALPCGINDYPPDFRDQDPIRRQCAGTGIPDAATGQVLCTTPTEQVCGRDGRLGVVLTVIATDFLAAGDAFPVALCDSTKPVIFGTAPPLTNSGTGTSGNCPNGDGPLFGNQCLMPVSSAGSPTCLPAQNTRTPALGAQNVDVATGNLVTCATQPDGVGAGAADGRLYGLNVYFLTTSGSGGYRKDVTVSKRPVTGAYTRIHQSRSMNTVNSCVGTCTASNATDQIGCLVQADECSLGYAGNSAELAIAGGYPTNFSTADALLIHGWDPSDANIQNNFAYPLSRKLYLNTLVGWNNVWGQELELAKYESIHGISDLPGAFVPVPGGPFLEDFNEQALCSATSNVNGCAGAPFTLTNAMTTCGDGHLDAYEDCDLGSGNGGPPATCSKTCRNNFAYVKPTGCTACPCPISP